MSGRQTSDELRVQVQRANDAALLRDKRFQSFCLRLLDTAGILRPNHRADPVLSAHAEGRRALGIEVLNTLLAADEDALQVIFPVASVMRSLIGEQTNPNEDPDGRPEPEFQR